MPYCPNCGSPVEGSVNFCPNCGQDLRSTSSARDLSTYVSDDTGDTSYTYKKTTSSSARDDYRVLLYSVGTCKTSQADDLLEDIMGYSNSDAKAIVASLPTEIAENLTRIQALTIAQALTEYGMEVVVMNDDGYVDLDLEAKSSVYDDDGSFVEDALKILGGITVANRLTRFVRRSLSSPRLFTLRYYEPKPPRHKRRFLSLWSREPDPEPIRHVERHPEPRGGFGGGFGGGPGGGPRGGGGPGGGGRGPGR